MRMLEPFGGGRKKQIQLYLSVSEAEEMVRELTTLLAEPNAYEHFHVMSPDGGGELSVSVVTQHKLKNGRYTTEEHECFGGWSPKP